MYDHYLPDDVEDFVLKHIEVKVNPIIRYEVSSPFSEYSYDDSQIQDKDHMSQLINDIILSNLDKLEHVDTRIYNVELDKVYWFIDKGKAPEQVTIVDINRDVEVEDDKIKIEEVVYFNRDNKLSRYYFFNYSTTLNNDFHLFNTKEEADEFYTANNSNVL